MIKTGTNPLGILHGTLNFLTSQGDMTAAFVVTIVVLATIAIYSKFKGKKPEVN